MWPDNVSPSGFVVAVLGFGLTRATVTLSVDGGLREFVFAGLVPLTLGLGLAVLGVVLALGSFEPWYVRTSAAWCLLGFLSMATLVGLTLVGTGTTGGLVEMMRADPIVANVLVGGSVGGTLTGMYAARTRRERRASRNRANRLVVLNRILREEVINAVTVIRANAEFIHDDDAAETVTEYADHITDTIEDVEFLTGTDGDRVSLGPVDLDRMVTSGVAAARDRHPEATVEVTGETEVSVHANDRLERVLSQLVENGIVHDESGTPEVAVSVSTAGDRVRVAVSDSGPGLPEEHRRILERGEIPEYDDPSAGFGLHVVRLLVESYGGQIETTVTEAGTTVRLTLQRATGQTVENPDIARVESYGVPLQRLWAAVGAALVAGAVMGVVFHVLAGAVPVIGALYGASDLVVGIITHEFHSVVFGVMYVALLAALPERFDTLQGRVLVGLAWAGFLWLFAAGFVMAAWLRLVGVPAPLPNLTVASLVGHLVWGLALGAVFHVLVDGRGLGVVGASEADENPDL